jgi:transposase
MFELTAAIRVYLVIGATDMRKSINGLSLIVSEYFNLDPFSGHMFVFTNKKKNMVKILYWDTNGFCLWHKRLEKDFFKWPESKEEVIAVGKKELMWLMHGLNIYQTDAHKNLKYKAVF